MLASAAAIEAANEHAPSDHVHELASQVNAAAAGLAGEIVGHPADAPTLDLDDVLTEMDRQLSAGHLPRGTYDLLITLFHGVGPTETEDGMRAPRGGVRARQGRAVDSHLPPKGHRRRKPAVPRVRGASPKAAGVPSDGPTNPTPALVGGQTSGAPTAPPAAAPPPVAPVEALAPKPRRRSPRRTGDTIPTGLSAAPKNEG